MSNFNKPIFMITKHTYSFKKSKIISLVIMKHKVSIWKKILYVLSRKLFSNFLVTAYKKNKRIVSFTSVWNATLWVSGQIKVDMIIQTLCIFKMYHIFSSVLNIWPVCNYCKDILSINHYNSFDENCLYVK